MPGRGRRKAPAARSGRGTAPTTGARGAVTTRAARTTRTSSRPAPPAAAPAAGPGERVWVLAVPFRAPAPGASWHAGLQAHVHVGATLPPALRPYAPGPYTLERFLEDELNEAPRDAPAGQPMQPRAEQRTGAAAIAAHAAAGGRMFLLGDDPGVGKTGTAVLGVQQVAAQRAGSARPVRSVLVVADRPAAITVPHWTRSIAAFGDGGLRWCVTTWDRLGKVAAMSTATGRRFDVVIADEAHMVRHTTTQRWKHWRSVSGAGRVKDAPYVLLATATPAHSPLELPYLAPHFAAVHGEPLRAWSDLPGRLAAHGFHVERGRYGWAWTRTRGSAGPTWRGCATGWPTATRRPRCTARRRGGRSR